MFDANQGSTYNRVVQYNMGIMPPYFNSPTLSAADFVKFLRATTAMSIEFNCPNIVYDFSTETQSRCNKNLIAPVDKAGSTVTCPSCKRSLTIPTPSRPFEKEDIMEIDFGNGHSVSPQSVTVAHDRTARCRKCGRPLDRKKVCQRCNYVAPNLGFSDKQIDAIKIKPVGFQLWLINILSQGMPIAVLASTVHFLFVVLSVGWGALILFSTEGVSRFWLLALLLTAAYFYVTLATKSYGFLRSPHARLAWFQTLFWNVILWAARSNHWASNRDRLVLDKRGAALADEDLDKMKDLKEVGVLDLEGTLITDQAFRFFYRMDRLECLVLKNTEVSHCEVFRLQQTKPKLWIWH